MIEPVFLYPRQRRAIKASLFRLQGGRCCYCDCTVRLAPQPWPLGGRTPDDFATLEHLQRVSDGGTSRADNLALACHLCNTTRHSINWVEPTLNSPVARQRETVLNSSITPADCRSGEGRGDCVLQRD